MASRDDYREAIVSAMTLRRFKHLNGVSIPHHLAVKLRRLLLSQKRSIPVDGAGPITDARGFDRSLRPPADFLCGHSIRIYGTYFSVRFLKTTKSVIRALAADQ